LAQLDAPVADWEEPAAHAEHDAAPCAGALVPGRQGKQLAERAALNEPGGQGAHKTGSAAPGVDRKDPAPQLAQLVAPVADWYVPTYRPNCYFL
jgi:hypothetical protein